MDGEHAVEVLRGDLVEVATARDARVVHQRVDRAERVECSGDHCAAVDGDVVTVGDRDAARGGDLVDHPLRRLGRRAGTPGVTAVVVDDDARTFGGEEQRVRPADAATGARDDRHLTVENPHVIPRFVCASDR